MGEAIEGSELHGTSMEITPSKLNTKSIGI